jgi:heme oxygenase
MSVTLNAPSRARALRAATNATHERLDHRIMAAEPFRSRARYGGFLLLQRAFHRDIDALYGNTALGRLLPGLDRRRRLELVKAISDSVM